VGRNNLAQARAVGGFIQFETVYADFKTAERAVSAGGQVPPAALRVYLVEIHDFGQRPGGSGLARNALA